MNSRNIVFTLQSSLPGSTQAQLFLLLHSEEGFIFHTDLKLVWKQAQSVDQQLLIGKQKESQSPQILEFAACLCFLSL